MCGIAGFNLSPNERVNSNRLARHLLLGIEHRGPHATGAAWRTEHGPGVVVQKRDLTASKWVKSLSMPKRAQTAVLHTRFWTQGRPEVNDNNHPITVGPITGVHNGTLDNDDDLFAALNVERRAEVDSEAIFALLAHGGPVYEAQHDAELLEHLSGAAAVAYVDTLAPANELHVARVVSSPLVVATTTAGSFIFASTKDAIVNACQEVGLTLECLDDKVQEGTYFRVQDGLIVEEVGFEPRWDYYNSPKRWWNRPSGSARSATTPSIYDGSNWCEVCQDFKHFCEQDGYCVPAHEPKALAPVKTYKEAKKPDNPTGWMSVGITETVNLFMGHRFETMGDEEFYYLYKERAEAIETFIERVEGNGALSASTTLDILNRNHWQTRPGDWVKTDVALPTGFHGGESSTHTYGQVVAVPQTFPSGDYLIRVMLGTADGGMEYALVKRKGVEFESTHKPKTLDTRVVPDRIAEVHSIEGEFANAF